MCTHYWLRKEGRKETRLRLKLGTPPPRPLLCGPILLVDVRHDIKGVLLASFTPIIKSGVHDASPNIVFVTSQLARKCLVKAGPDPWDR